MQELQVRGIQTDDEPAREDFGWYFTFALDGKEYAFVLGYRPGDGAEGEWIGWLERNCSFWVSLLGGRKRGVAPAAAAVIHAVLSTSEQIHDVVWHYDQNFSSGREDLGSSEP